ncbi:MAG: hypothetical protein ACPKPY_04360 [Nitrososphaeraceae archaeon]
MSNDNVPNPLKEMTMTQLLYDHYELDSIKYVIDMHRHLLRSLDNILPKEDPIRNKKIAIFRYEIIARFCHFAEALGALIRAFYLVKKDKSPSTSLTNKHPLQILDLVSKYYPGDIPKFYEELKTNIDDENLIKIFGYDYIDKTQHYNIISNSIKNIKKILNDEISPCYLYLKESYNAYKHGYRIWPAIEYNVNSELIIYRDKYSSSTLSFPDITSWNEFKDKYVIMTDDPSLDVITNNLSQYCLDLFFLLRDNNKEVFNRISGKNHSETLKLKILDDNLKLKNIQMVRNH